MKSYDARIIHNRYVKKCRKAFIFDVIASEIIAYCIHIGLYLMKGKDFFGALEAVWYGNVFMPIVLMMAVYICGDLILGGRSVGKRLFGLHVVDRATGCRPSKRVLFIRNLPICLLPFELVYQIVLGESLGDKPAGTVVLPVEGQTKDGLIPEWMEVTEGLTITKLKRIGAIAFVVFVIAASVVSMIQATKTEEYTIARDHLIASEADLEQDALVILTSLRSTTVNYEDYREHTVEFQFLVDGKMRTVVCRETEDGWEVVSP